MGQTTKYQLPYPEQSDPPDGPAQIKALADKLDPIILTPSVFDAKGDLLVGSADDVMARLARGTDGNVLTADAASALGLKWAPPTGGGGGTQLSAAVVGELAYAQITAGVNITATTEATANTVVAAPAVSLDGATTIVVSFFAPAGLPPSAASAMNYWLFEDGVSIGAMGYHWLGTTNQGSPVFLARRVTPANGNHVYSVRASVTSGSGSIGAGTGGAGQNVPAFIRINRADSAANVGVSGPSPAARVYHNADQSTTSGAPLTVAFNSERFDTDTIHDSATQNTRLTCRTAGRYVIAAQIGWDAIPGGTLRRLFLQLNGTNNIAEDIRPPLQAGNWTRQAVSTIYDLNVGDYVEVIATQDSASAVALKAVPQAVPEFSMARITDVGGGLTVGIGTTLPASPFDGQEFVLVDSLTAPTYQWRFRYTAGITDAYKWVFVGGNKLWAEVNGIDTISALSFADAPTVGPQLTTPRAGHYLLTYTAALNPAAVANGLLIASPSIGGAPPNTNDNIVTQNPAAGQFVASCAREVMKNGLAASAVVKLQYMQASGNGVVSRRTLSILPVRVS